ncbi:hypothetical protein FRN31_22280 [Vibrio alginolyticus]|nr:hypothetical protein [Vibrio alginolyticus]
MRRQLTASLLSWKVLDIEPDEELQIKGGFILSGICKPVTGKKLLEGERIFTSRVLSHSVEQLTKGVVVEVVGGSLYMLGQPKSV